MYTLHEDLLATFRFCRDMFTGFKLGLTHLIDVLFTLMVPKSNQYNE